MRDGDVPTVGPPVSEAERERVLLAENDPPAGSGSAAPKQLAAGSGDPKKGEQKKSDRKEKAPPPRSIETITVDLSSQEMTLHWSDGTAEGPRAISSGRGQPNTPDDPCKTQTEDNCTPVGTFTVGKQGDADHKNTDGDAMAWYVEFEGKGADNRGIGIHDSQRVVKGTPLSHGCVRTGASEADWRFARK